MNHQWSSDTSAHPPRALMELRLIDQVEGENKKLHKKFLCNVQFLRSPSPPTPQ